MQILGVQGRNFNPRSLAGATTVNGFGRQVIQNFNPRSLAGATAGAPLPPSSTTISIHAPSRERPQTYSVIISQPDFNPRSLAGATMPSIKRLSVGTAFQSTLPRGSDFRARHCIWHCAHFNPRSLAGATTNAYKKYWYNRISIHAPSRERLKEPEKIFDYYPISIHAPSRERHHNYSFLYFAKSYFNPRSLAGATEEHNRWYSLLEIFQSTLPRGSDPHY